MYVKINGNIEIWANKIAKIFVIKELRRENLSQNKISLFVFNSMVEQKLKLIYTAIIFVLLVLLLQIF